MASTAKSLIQTLKRYIKAPWAYTGPQASPEYKSALPLATEYRLHCPATIVERAVVPSSDPETVYDIKYYTRDPRNKPNPVKRAMLSKDEYESMMKAEKIDVKDFPKPYKPRLVNEAFDIVGDGYEDGLPKTVDPTRYKVVYKVV